MADADTEPKLGFFETLTTFPRSFWMGCGVEMWERLAYYGVRQVVGLYIAQADDPSGLHFTQAQKGTIFFWWALVQSLVPMVSGGIADRFGYKRTIATSVLLTLAGYALMGTQHGFGGFMAGCLVLAFSLGEMLTGPKKTEYFSLIAPKGKKALYLGYVNIPIAIGQSVGAKIAAWQYGTYGEKATLALRYLAEKTSFVPGHAWNGDPATLEATLGIQRKTAFATLVKELGQDPNAVNQLLWTTYRPYQVWYPFAAIGLCSLVGILIFSRVSKRWKDMDV